MFKLELIIGLDGFLVLIIGVGCGGFCVYVFRFELRRVVVSNYCVGLVWGCSGSVGFM